MPLIAWAVLAHIIADWFLQNAWMADNKANWRHAAAWVHSGIHLFALLFVFPPLVALAVAVAHFLIDLRFILRWWRKTIRQTTEGPAAIHVAFWQDQAAHYIVLCIACWFVTK